MFRRRAVPVSGAEPGVWSTGVLDVPGGPGGDPEVDSGIVRRSAEQEGALDADSYDAPSLQVAAPFPYERELAAATAQACGDSLVAQDRAQQVADHLEAEKHAHRDRADMQVGDSRRRVEDADRQCRTTVGVLTGSGPYTDPSRVQETRWTTLRTLLLTPTAVAGLELGLNIAALEGFDLPLTETVALAVVFGVVGVLAPHMAGARARKFRGQTTPQARWARWGLPVAAMVGLILVQGMMAALRTGFLDTPQINPTTHTAQTSLLTQIGMPAGLMLTGWWAVQVVLSLVVAWHAEKTHNPYVTAHRIAGQQLRARQDELARAIEEAARAELTAGSATQDRQRVAAMFQAQRDRYQVLAAQAIEIYGRSMARHKADPAFTSAMEMRLAKRRAASTDAGVTDLGKKAA